MRERLRFRVRPLARAALAVGAQGLLVEAHVHPDRSYTDAAQTIDIDTLRGIQRDAEFLRGLEQPNALPESERSVVG